MIKYVSILFLMIGLCYSQNVTGGSTQIHGSMNKALSQDGATNNITYVSQGHHEVHEGRHFMLHGWSALGNGDTLMYVFSTPNTTRWSHMLFDFTSSGIIESRVQETCTVTLLDTIIPPNNNRNSSKLSVNFVGITSTDSVSSFGTCMDSVKVGSSGGSKFGGSISRDNEIIFKQNTTYIYMFISGSASNIITHKHDWYELIDKN
ncbi:MAG: hypothetical protein KAS32_14950 [Candidatus Peribacteraceae bacterium]|nr:hypothetical protein [Candidatus Peribacteraceae bacterium]